MAEVASRSISFLVDIYLKQRAGPTEEERLRSLQRLLLRLRVVVEEADVRLIASQAMLHQLSILKKEMYRGYYTLDIFSCRAHNGEDRRKDQEVNYSFAPSDFNPAKRVCLFRGNSKGAGQAKLLDQVLGSVRDTIEDMNGDGTYHVLPIARGECPRRCEDLAVLPIIGPSKVGKSTLIEHACEDARVRNHFSQILCFNGDDLKA
ncbi:hypothetical protein ACQ4PT_027368 [Festuca glaucescens]